MIPRKRVSLMLAAAALSCCVSSYGQAPQPQVTSITFARQIDADLATVRAAIADPVWSKWIPFLKSSRCSGEAAGSTRVCVMADPTGKMDGYQIQERITENDPMRGRFAYTISNPPLPVRGFSGVVETQAAGPKTLLMWTATYQVDPVNAAMAKDALMGMYQGALDGLNEYVQEMPMAGDEMAKQGGMGGQLTLVDIVVLQEGRTLAERDKYEAYIKPIAARYGVRLVQSFDVTKHLSGGVERAARVNVWTLPNAEAMKKLSADPDYEKAADYRNAVHVMEDVTLYLAGATLVETQPSAGKVLVDLVVMQPGYGIAERNDYEAYIEPIAARCGMRKIYSANVRKHLRGDVEDAIRVNLWHMASGAAMEQLNSDPDYQRNIPNRNRIHNMEAVTLMMAEPAGGVGMR